MKHKNQFDKIYSKESINCMYLVKKEKLVLKQLYEV